MLKKKIHFLAKISRITSVFFRWKLLQWQLSSWLLLSAAGSSIRNFFLKKKQNVLQQTDHRKTIPTSPRKNPCLCTEKMFLSDPGLLLAFEHWGGGGVKLKTMEKTFTFTFLGVTKGSYPSYPPPPTVESDSCGTTGCAKNCRRTGLRLQPSSNTTGTFPSLLVFLNPEINVPEKHGGFFLRTCFFGILSGQNTLDLQDLPLVFVLCCLELLILTIWLQYRIQVFGICKNISPNGDLTH